MQDQRPKIPLPDAAEDLVYTVTRASTAANTAALTVVLAGLIDVLDKTHTDHVKLRRTVTQKDGTMGGVRLDVELFCTHVQAKVLGMVNQDRLDPKFVAYFPQSASALCGSDFETLKKWLVGVAPLLLKDPEKVLVDLAPTADALVIGWQKAETGQTTANAANRQHGAKVRDPLRDQVNGERRKLYGDLIKLAVTEKRPKRWVESFFRRTPKKGGGEDPKG